jgi:hypothetical protein
VSMYTDGMGITTEEERRIHALGKAIESIPTGLGVRPTDGDIIARAERFEAYLKSEPGGAGA